MFLPLLLVVAASLVFFHRLTERIEPMVETIAASKAVNLISLAINDAVDESLIGEQLGYQDFVETKTGEMGQITSLAFKTTEGARFKRLVTDRMIFSIGEINTNDLEIPLGNLSGVMLLSALGPNIRVKVQSVGDVTTEYRNEFTAAGVNQTRHSIYLDVSATIYLLIPGKVLPVTVEESVCLAETVIVGDVPDTYLNLQNGVN